MNGTAMFVAQECRRKITHYESLIRQRKQQIAALSHQVNPQRAAQIKRLEREIEGWESRIKRIRRTGNPF